MPGLRSPRLGPTAAPVVLGVSLLLLGGCGAARYHASHAAPRPSLDLPAASATRHLVLVSIDGLRPDAIAAYETPTLRRLMAEGAYSLSATTILPSKTLPSHVSMLTGELPDEHGVLWNDAVRAKADAVEVPTVFGVARERGYRTAAFFSKSKFHPLQSPEALDYSQAPGGWFGRWSSSRTAEDVAEYLATGRPNLLFVHLADPDRAGHGKGWMSPAYGAAVAGTDAALATVLAASEQAFGEGNYAVIVTADHGGHGRDHGSDDPLDVTIPWIAWGQGVRSAGPIESPIRTVDTASTVLWALGLSEPTDWTGAPVLGAFAPTTVAAVPPAATAIPSGTAGGR